MDAGTPPSATIVAPQQGQILAFIGTLKCPTRYLHPQMVHCLPFFSVHGHHSLSNPAHLLPVKTQLCEIQSGLYNKHHLIKLSNIETVELSNGHWKYLMMGLSDTPMLGQLDTLTVSMSECPTLGQLDTPTVLMSECPTLEQSECPDIG